MIRLSPEAERQLNELVLLGDVEQVARGPGKATKTRDHDNVTFPNLVDSRASCARSCRAPESFSS